MKMTEEGSLLRFAETVLTSRKNTSNVKQQQNNYAAAAATKEEEARIDVCAVAYVHSGGGMYITCKQVLKIAVQ